MYCEDAVVYLLLLWIVVLVLWLCGWFNVAARM
jgi:hypothetical protein